MEKMTENTNPLQKYFRQPSVYIKLPSGLQYGTDVIEPSTTGELAVLPMTAMDEVKFKTPDALMNGQGVVDVIQSCIPQIKDAWKITSYDLDSIFLAIRIATYGETMDMNATVPVVNEQIGHTVNLPALLESVKNIEIRDSFKTESGFEVFVKPLSYKQTTEAQVKTFEQQKIVAAVGQSSLTDEQKSQKFVPIWANHFKMSFYSKNFDFPTLICP